METLDDVREHVSASRTADADVDLDRQVMHIGEALRGLLRFNEALRARAAQIRLVATDAPWLSEVTDTVIETVHAGLLEALEGIDEYPGGVPVGEKHPAISQQLATTTSDVDRLIAQFEDWNERISRVVAN